MISDVNENEKMHQVKIEQSQRETAKFDGAARRQLCCIVGSSCWGNSSNFDPMATWSRNLWRLQWTMVFTMAIAQRMRKKCVLFCDDSVCLCTLLVRPPSEQRVAQSSIICPLLIFSTSSKSCSSRVGSSCRVYIAFFLASLLLSPNPLLATIMVSKVQQKQSSHWSIRWLPRLPLIAFDGIVLQGAICAGLVLPSHPNIMDTHLLFQDGAAFVNKTFSPVEWSECFFLLENCSK